MYKFHVLISLVLFTFISCQKESATTNPPASTMTIELDGVAQTTTGFNNTLLFLQQNGEDGRRLDLRANIGSNMFILSASNWDFQNPPADGILSKIYETNTVNNTPIYRSCTMRPAGNLCDAGLATYTANGLTYMSGNIAGEPMGSFTITQNNTTDKTVTGTFDIKVVNLIQPSSTPLHFTGSFSDLSYTVLN